MSMRVVYACLLLCGSVLAQNASPTPVPKIQFFDNSGNPLAGGFVYTFAAGTTTQLASYTDSSANTPNTNPVVLQHRRIRQYLAASQRVLQAGGAEFLWRATSHNG